jgi:riboflavin kinase / FMN adenylyltransferase
MNSISWENLQRREGCKDVPTAATIGVFDGVHIGHQALIREITTAGEELHPLVITFRENPVSVLHRNRYRGDIYTLEQKLEAFQRLGVETAVLIDFSHNFSKLSGRDFIFTVYNSVKLTLLVLGNNFRCGEQAHTTAEMVRQYLQNSRCEVRVLEQVTVAGTPVSSTRIRDMILQGDFDTIEKFLGRKYTVDIRNVEKENYNSSTVIKRDRIRQLLPPTGTYSVTLENGVSQKEGCLSIYDNTVTFNEPAHFKTTQLCFI